MVASKQTPSPRVVNFKKTLQVRNECLTRKPNGIVLDACVVKWDGYERLERVRDVYDRVRRAGVDG